MLLSRICGAISVLAAYLMFSSQSVCQQDFAFKVTPTDQARKKVTEFIDAENKAATVRLSSIAATISRVCALSEKQQQKLKVAAKGVMENRYQSRYDETIDFVRNIARQNPNAQVIITTKAPREIDTDRKWISTLNSVLTEEQNGIYKKWQDERRRFLRASVVNQLVTEIDVFLFLSAKQREDLIVIVDSNFGDKLATQFLNEVGRNKYRQSKSIPDPKYLDLVQNLLSEEQLEEWKRSVEPRLQELR